MRTIVHIGAHRTGTTSIQTALFESQDLLYDAGIAALTAVGGREILFDPLQKFASSTGDVKEQLREHLSVVVAETYKLADNASTIIFSEENILGNMGVIFQGDQIGKMALQNLRAFAEFLPTDFEIVLSIRDYANYYNSAFTYQFCKTLFHPFDYYRNTLIKRSYDWFALIKLIRRAFPNNQIHVVPYESYCTDFTKFFRHLGIPEEIELKTRHENRTRSALAIQRLEENLSSGKEMTPAITKGIVQRAHRRGYTPYDPWSPEERKLLTARYNLHLKRIRQKLKVNLIE